MIKSMTGYGGAKSTDGGIELSVELKSVNNRYLDTSVRIPRGFLFAEEAIKSMIQRSITRGKVDVFVSVSSSSANDVAVTVNEALAAEYKSAIDLIGIKLGIDHEVTAYELARFQDVLTVDKKELDKELIMDELTKVIQDALSDFNAMRLKEGEKLYQDISGRLNTLEKYVTYIEERSPQTVEEYRQRLTAKMQEVLGNSNIDESRILTEAAIYADHIAVDEETVRLRSHISQMREMISGESPVGRKLDFTVQELNRETNTIGSKCNDQNITKVVLDMKSEIEKIREQVQNIE